MATIKRVHEITEPSVNFIDIQDIEIGDLLILQFGGKNSKASKIVTVELVKETETDGIEVIYDLKKNHYFSLTDYRSINSSIYRIYRIEV
jgi:hypothetical protein